ncbi:Plant disease resistance response protein [Corchorus capsularis]|uniref:Dirigent protein n=1 Tax=Corchorus capsularis TaxID=210143 RepID=A0A1R3GKZ8_COCAP|nr:Plant disease resistance response protein [Corchorus capsularis]
MAVTSKPLLLIAIILAAVYSTHALKQEVTRIQFYMHDIIGGPKPTAVRVAGRSNFSSPDPIAATFGSIYMMDNPLTATPNINSTLVGRAQGLYGMSSQEKELSLIMTLTYSLTTGPYNGSTFSVLGRNPVMNQVREMPVVGGTGKFRLARGYCLARTYSMKEFDAVIGYNNKTMCTPWTLTRFVRWRVKDLASCFLACRFPLEGETETRHSASSQVPIANMVFETHDDTGGDYNNKKSKKRLSRRNRGNNGDRQVNPSPTVENENGSGGGGGDNSSWRGFSDEEYIVFCFREDGAFDVVKDYKSSEEYIHSRKSSSPQKLNNAAEDAERDNNKQSSNEGIRSNEEEVINIPAKEGDGEGNSSICLEIELGSGSLRRRRLRSQSQVEGTPNQGVASVESSDSNQSDGSTGSFAFPVLGWEWMGSPVQMPKLDSDSEGEEEGMSPSKNKALSVRFQCLRF